MMRKQSKTGKDKLENVQTTTAAASLTDPTSTTTTTTESIASTTAATTTTIASALSPSSPESECQTSSLPGVVGGQTSSLSMATTTTATASSFICDEPIPPPSPFDQPSTSRDFPFKV